MIAFCVGFLAAGFLVSPATADSSLSPYVISRMGTTSTYTATPASGSVITGPLKDVVETAVSNLNSGGGGTVRFLSATYDLGSTWWEFYDLNDIVFEGAGMGQTIITNNVSAATDTEPFDMTASDRITIRDLTVDANGPLRSTSDAIDFDGGDLVVIERVEISGSRARGIIFDGKGSGSISHADNNTVRDCYVHDIPGAGIELLASNNNVIDGCTIEDVGGYGIRVTKSSSTATQPNKPSNDNVISNNVINQAGSDGIFVNSSNRNQLRGNSILNSADDTPGRSGIQITSSNSEFCDDNTVRTNIATDNQATKTQRYGLNIASSNCHRTVVGSDNDFQGNLTGEIRDNGTNTIYEMGNQRPVVSAGSDVSVSVSGDASLDGAVSDDGPPPLTTVWSQQGGPAGGASFANASAVDTLVSFAEPGVYTLRLTATDGEALSAFDEVVVTVTPDGLNVVDVQITSGLDDAEERANGSVSRSSTDLELVTDSSVQTVGVRFPGVAVPTGATITNAWVQFTVDEVTTGAASLAVQVELSPNASAITGNSLNVSSRLAGATSAVSWNPAAWPTANVAGPDQRTPSLTGAIQQVVDQAGWSSGNAMMVIVTGSGRRTAEAYNGSPTGAPTLHIEYMTGGNQRPVVSAGSDVSVSVSGDASLDGAVSDDGPPPLTTVWSQQGGPAGGASFANASAVDTLVSFAEPGVYTLRLTATDGEALSAFDEVVVTVTPDGLNVVDVQITSGLDDAEERANGSVSRSSTDLELVTDSSVQTVGVRFPGVAVPTGATITNAWVQFTVDEVTTGAASLAVQVELSPNASAITGNSLNVSSRLAGATSAVSWNPAAWPTANVAGPDQRTPSLTGAIQQVVDQAGWSSGNAMMVIVTGSGRRTAEAYNGSPTGAPTLHIEYMLP